MSWKSLDLKHNENLTSEWLVFRKKPRKAYSYLAKCINPLKPLKIFESSSSMIFVNTCERPWEHLKWHRLIFTLMVKEVNSHFVLCWMANLRQQMKWIFNEILAQYVCVCMWGVGVYRGVTVCYFRSTPLPPPLPTLLSRNSNIVWNLAPYE